MRSYKRSNLIISNNTTQTLELPSFSNLVNAYVNELNELVALFEYDSVYNDRDKIFNFWMVSDRDFDNTYKPFEYQYYKTIELTASNIDLRFTNNGVVNSPIDRDVYHIFVDIIKPTIEDRDEKLDKLV
jgi:hypothetical protein